MEVLEKFLYATITLAPVGLAGFASFLLYKQLISSSEFTRILGVCLLFSLLGFGSYRLITIKFFGGEAQLTEIKTVADRAAASVDEMEKVKESLQDVATILARQQALSVMKAGRLGGDDFLTKNIHSLLELKKILVELNVTENKIETVLDAAVPYIRIDLKDAVSTAVHKAFTERAKTSEATLGIPKRTTEFYDQFLHEYETGETAQRAEAYLRNHDVEITDSIRESFNRLDAFLNEGHYLDLEGNIVMTFLNPTSPPFLR